MNGSGVGGRPQRTDFLQRGQCLPAYGATPLRVRRRTCTRCSRGWSQTGCRGSVFTPDPFLIVTNGARGKCAKKDDSGSGESAVQADLCIIRVVCDRASGYVWRADIPRSRGLR